MDVGNYQIKTAENLSELVQCFKLRHEVFYREFQGQDKTGLDVDRFDTDFDHLVIFHKPSQKIIGTYRLCCTAEPRHAYTALEFDLSTLNKQTGPFLELGRACIQKDHRRGSVISLLWRGIAEYMNLSGANILYGCSSAKINNARDAALVYTAFIDQGVVASDVDAHPTRAFHMKDFGTWFNYFAKGLSEEQKVEANELVPPLISSYIKLGAKIAGPPAFDSDFDCIDFLTVLKKQDLGDSLARRFQIVR
jgi:putative hemolysin